MKVSVPCSEGSNFHLLLVGEQLFQVVDDDDGLLGVEEGRASLLALVFADDAVKDHRKALFGQTVPPVGPIN